MNFMNLAHASLYMIGALLRGRPRRLDRLVRPRRPARPAGHLSDGDGWSSGSVLQNLYRRHHLDQVLVTFGLIMIANEAVRMIWGTAGLYVTVPPFLSGTHHAAAPARSIRSIASSSSSPALRRRARASTSSSATRASACWYAPAPTSPRWSRRSASTSARSFRAVVAFGAALAALRRRADRARCFRSSRGWATRS